MTISRPYYRTVRPFADASYRGTYRDPFILDPRYAVRPDQAVRTFLLLQDDIRRLFDYVEPVDQNRNTFSLRILELLLRTCVEVEANFKEILRANKFRKAHQQAVRLTMDRDYYLVNKSHFLSEYQVWVPGWHGQDDRCPFSAWGGTQYESLTWYQAYNAAKHDRIRHLSKASLDNLVEAWCGLAVLITAQFLNTDFVPGQDPLTVDKPNNREGFHACVGSFLQISYPADVPADARYEFEWAALARAPEPFQRFDYDALT